MDNEFYEAPAPGPIQVTWSSAGPGPAERVVTIAAAVLSRRDRPLHFSRLSPLALAAGLLAGGGACHGQQAPAVTALTPSTALTPPPRGAAARELPIVLQARQIRSQLDVQTVAEGEVEFRRGGVVIRSDRMSYDTARDLAGATGSVRIEMPGAVYTGPELQLQVQSFEGYFLEPQFWFTELGAGGRAERIDFFGRDRLRATRAEYTSCPREGPAEPDWLLRADSVRIDQARNEGVAEGAVLRFLGVPILALPSLSFPLSDARKSGWLPPSVQTDSRSGVELSVPYYWNIAPNLDATLTPRLITRRGLAVDSEFRYLQPRDEGAVAVDWLPDDRILDRSRHAVQWLHEGNGPGRVRYAAEVLRVSDDEWWKDFPDASRSLTPRLLPLRLGVERPFEIGSRTHGRGNGRGLVYARVLQWQVLQGSDAVVVSPYQRSPQVGVQIDGVWRGWEAAAEGEYNRFTLPTGEAAQAGRVGGGRLHLVGSVSRPLRRPGWWWVPRLAINAASYRVDGEPDDGAQRRRLVPTLSIDTGLSFERPTTAFGRALQQTLEPRLLYVRTPYRAQSTLPNYDAAGKDFNFGTIYTTNQFSGVDRVSDAHQLTAGVTTRFVDRASGAEALRLGLVQRFLFRPQLVTAQPDGTPDGAPLESRFSDALLLGSTGLIPRWTLDAAVQYSPDLQRPVRSIVGARYSPGPYRTVSTGYRLTRGLTEQLELGWQWPLSGSSLPAPATAGPPARGCNGALYTVGRVSYSLKDSRVTDSVLGLEYDAGCWLGRVVAERLSTGRSEATTRLMVQLELVGLSRLGSNPLKVLKDNVPGYRLLREERGGALSNADRIPASTP